MCQSSQARPAVRNSFALQFLCRLMEKLGTYGWRFSAGFHAVAFKLNLASWVNLARPRPALKGLGLRPGPLVSGRFVGVSRLGNA